MLLGEGQLRKPAHSYGSQGRRSRRHGRNVEKEHGRATRVRVGGMVGDRAQTKTTKKRRDRRCVDPSNGIPTGFGGRSSAYRYGG